MPSRDKFIAGPSRADIEKKAREAKIEKMMNNSMKLVDGFDIKTYRKQTATAWPRIKMIGDL